MLAPKLDPAPYAFCRFSGRRLPAGVTPFATVLEAEGLTLILPLSEATAAGLAVDFEAARVSLTVHSDLGAVGLTARVATALAAAGIPCNVVAATWHDHIFVPRADGARALVALEALSGESASEEVIYSVTVEVEEAIAEEWLGWMRLVHVPDVLRTGCFLGCEIAQRLDPASPAGVVVFVLEYRAPSERALAEYRERHAPEIQRAHTERYGTRARATRTIRTVLAPPGSASS
jgi:hypothetical protein